MSESPFVRAVQVVADASETLMQERAIQFGSGLTVTRYTSGVLGNKVTGYISVAVDSSLFAAASATVTTTAPIKVNGGTSATLASALAFACDAASGSGPGSMSSSHYTLVAGAVATPTASRIAMFDASAGLTGEYLVASTYAQIAQYVELPEYAAPAPGAGKARIYTSTITGDPATITDEDVELQLASRTPVAQTKSGIDASAGSPTTEGGPIHMGSAGGKLLAIYWINMGTAISTNETDYVTFEIHHYDVAGTEYPASPYTLSTNAAGSGSMAANGRYRFTTPASVVTFADGDYLTRAITKQGGGQTVGKGAWIVVVNQ